MKRIFGLFFVFGILLSSFMARAAYAADVFDTAVDGIYKFSDDGKVSTTLNISSRNLTTEKYLETFRLTLNSNDYQNIDVARNRIPIHFELNKTADKTEIVVNFPDKVVGRDQVREFSISFESSELANKTGKTWEITLPKIVNEQIFDHSRYRILVPESYGQLATISPEPDSLNSSEGWSEIEYIDKESGVINATFGIYQVYSFDITYHLENPLKQSSSQEVAIIPDTSFQRVFYQDMDPRPESITQDADGNWIASYKLEPRQKVDAKITGLVQLLPEAISKGDQIELEQYLQRDTYWEADDPKIKELAARLGTAKNIYDYVVQTLNYDYKRVTPTVHRLGALEALNNPDNAICMEFTDLFIALARAAGIPAREINGYAHTTNPNLQPLSLVADVLHSWPQYWDFEKEQWISLDPTWEKTTGGINYFDNRDLKHIVFVIHGADSEKPYPPGSYKLGSVPQKDVYISFSALPDKRKATTTLSLTHKTTSVGGSKYDFQLENHGPVAVYDKEINIYFDDKLQETLPISMLAPFSSFDFASMVPLSFLGRDYPEKLTITFDEQKLELATEKSDVVLIKYFAVFIIVLLAMLLLLIKIKHKS